jgi:DNA-binding NarL/FixJ family response regulator
MTDKITILLADDHNVLRQGMAQMIDAQADMKVVAQASDGSEAVSLARKERPDIVLMDINMPKMDGVEAARRITAELPETSIIVLTMYRRDNYVFEAIKAGASGYLLKETELDELLAAIRAVARGEAVIDPAIASRVLAEFRQQPKVEEIPDSRLSDRDVDILRLVAQGLSNQEIGAQLFISEKTVRNRLSLVFRQLHLKNRTEAALYALRKGLVSPDEPEDE